MKKKLTIMMIIGSLGDGGKERQLSLLLRLLKETERFSIFLVVGNPGGEREDEVKSFSDEMFILKGGTGNNLISPFLKMYKIVKFTKPDLIHTWGSGIWDMTGVWVAKLRNIPVLHNGIQSAPGKLDISDYLTKLSAFFADKIVANSEAGLRAFGHFNNPKSCVIYNGLDLSRFETVKISQDRQNLCMVANFRKEKDHLTLIQALADIVKNYPDVRLILVGHNYGTLKDVKSMASCLGLDDHIVYLTDCLEPAPIIAISQICILSTHGEGVSNVLLEYMALSKPIIVTNNGGNPEVVIDQVNGYLIPPKSPESIVEKVDIMFSDLELAKKMGKAGKHLVKQKFSLDAMVDAFEVMYSQLIEAGQE